MISGMVLGITLDCMINATQLSASKNPKSVQVKFMKYIVLNFHYYLPITGPSPLDRLPPDFLCDAEAAGDQLVAKAVQLIQNKTTNITENFMSIRCKMDGVKFYNRIQSGSFQHRSMAAALWVQCGPG